MTLGRSFLVWLALFMVAFANGLFRESFLTGPLGEARAHQLSSLLGAALMFAAIWAFARQWPFRSAAHAWRTGALWLVLTIAWEFLFGHFVVGHAWERLLRDYAIWRGRLWMLVLAAILTAPAAVFAIERRRTRQRR